MLKDMEHEMEAGIIHGVYNYPQEGCMANGVISP